MEGIRFFRKNIIDRTNQNVAVTITDPVATSTGLVLFDRVRNRNNLNGWITTGSTDAANTQLDIEWGQTRDFDTLIFVGINWKAYTVQYYDEATEAYVDFSTAISVSNNSVTTKFHRFDRISSAAIRIIITETMTADDDKRATQIYIGEQIGQFTTGVEITRAEFYKRRKTKETTSAKWRVTRTLGGFRCSLMASNVQSDSDLILYETLMNYYEGFHVWLCGGDTSQFRYEREGYRLEDFFFMNVTNDLDNTFGGGYYKGAVGISLDLVEVTADV